MPVVQIPPDSIARVWPAVSPFIDKGIEHAEGAYTNDGLMKQCEAQQAQLWVILVEDDGKRKISAAAVTSLHQAPTGKKSAEINLLGGENMKKWFSTEPDGPLPEFEKWAAAEGCENIRIWGRKAWLKELPDYRLTHYILQKDLTP